MCKEGEAVGASEAAPDRRVVNNQDDIRVGYQAALQMAIYDGQLSWQVTGIFVQFGILMIAGAVFPGFVGTEDKFILGIAGLAVSLAGIVMTSMFGSMVMRIRTYEEYWIHCAIQLESSLDDTVETISGSAVLSRRGLITVGAGTVRMGRTSAVKTKQMLTALFLCFLITFIVLFCIDIWRFGELIFAQSLDVGGGLGSSPTAPPP